MRRSVILSNVKQSPFKYERHQPEGTLLYKIIEEHYPLFVSHLAEQGRVLPTYVQQEFEDYLKCGRLEYGFFRVYCQQCKHERMVAFSCKHRGFCPSCCAKRMVESSALLVDSILPRQPIRQWVLSIPYALRFLFASQPQVMGKALGIVYRAISGYMIKKAGLTRQKARTGAVTLIQRFGSALNLNVHFHMLFLDGVYVDAADKRDDQRFVSLTHHQASDIIKLTHKISLRLARYLERAGLIEQDAENSYLTASALGNEEMNAHQKYSIDYRICIGPKQGKKVFTLQTLPPKEKETHGVLVGRVGGFSLHAEVSVNANQRNQLERLCRYITRPGVSEQRLSLTSQGHIRYELKTPYRNGTTHVLFEPLDFISKLVALIPMPRVNLTRFHGVFAPHNRYRAIITKSCSAVENKTLDDGLQTETEKRGSMTWAVRLKRAFNIDINTCERCGGAVKVIACIDDPAVIQKILDAMHSRHGHHQQNQKIKLPYERAPPGRLSY